MSKKYALVHPIDDEKIWIANIKILREIMEEEGYNEVIISDYEYETNIRMCHIAQWPIDHESCDRECKDYEPRNGKSGICRWNRGNYSPTGNKYKLTQNSFELIKED